MGYKGSLGTPVNIVGMPKNKATRSCRNCEHYSEKWCAAFKITCSSLANAKLCNKFKNKYGKQHEVSKKVRCSTCEFIYFNTVQSGRSRKKQHAIYKCSKKNQEVTYNKVGICDKYQKQKPKEETVTVGNIYKKGTEEYRQLISEIKEKTDKQELRTLIKCKICGREHSYKGDLEKATQSFYKGHLLKTHQMTPGAYEEATTKNKLIIE